MESPILPTHYRPQTHWAGVPASKPVCRPHLQHGTITDLRTLNLNPKKPTDEFTKEAHLRFWLGGRPNIFIFYP